MSAFGATHSKSGECHQWLWWWWCIF